MMDIMIVEVTWNEYFDDIRHLPGYTPGITTTSGWTGTLHIKDCSVHGMIGNILYVTPNEVGTESKHDKLTRLFDLQT